MQIPPSTMYLKNNRFARISDYVKAFKICRQTASKCLKQDAESLQVNKLTVAHFYKLYLSFPPAFKPELIPVIGVSPKTW